MVLTLVLCAGASLLVAKAGQMTMRALGLDLWGMLVWFGLAETQVDELAARRLARARQTG